jgi:SsrA-binding protein
MKVVNRRFHRQYQLIEKAEAGIALIGAEVKSLRAGNIRLEYAFVKIVGSEVYLVNAEIPIYQFSRPQSYDPKRTRKLLLHKKEIMRLKGKLSGSARLTIAPLSCYNKGVNFKIEIALVRGRGEIEKKKLEKKIDIEREEERKMKEYLKS